MWYSTNLSSFILFLYKIVFHLRLQLNILDLEIKFKLFLPKQETTYRFFEKNVMKAPLIQVICSKNTTHELNVLPNIIIEISH